jgi:hypothetical protein
MNQSLNTASNTAANRAANTDSASARRSWFRTAGQAIMALSAGGALTAAAATAQASRNSRKPAQFNAQALSDRAAIEDVLTRYTYAMDTKNWALMESLFTTDATADFSKVGGPAKPIESAKGIAQLLRTALGTLITQHVSSNALIELQGDRANVTSYLLAQHWRKSDGVEFISRGRHVDVLVRDKATGNWLLQSRTLDPIHFTGNPAVIGS